MTRNFLLAASLLASVSVTATASARPMTPEDVAKIESVGAIAVSPDGSRVAYTTSRLPDVTEGEKNGPSKRQLSIASGPDNSRMFLPEDVSPSGIRFSPDGRMVSFIWKGEGDDSRAVWGIPVDGGAQRKLAHVKNASVRSYEWSPDGSLIYMIVSAGKDGQRAAQKKAGFNSIVYEEEAPLNRLFSASVGDGMDEEPNEISVPGYISSFQISADGRLGILKTAPTPKVDDSYVLKRVNIMNLATGKLTIVNTPGKIGDVEISPDSSKLSLIAGTDANDPAATTLHLVDTATGAFSAVNGGAPEAAIDAEFLPTGQLAAVIHKGATSFLRLYDANGIQLNEIEAEGLAVTGIDAGANRVVVRASSASHPSELFNVSQNGAISRWTHHNNWLSQIDFGTQRVVRYKARDGQMIEGIFIEPVGGIPKGGAPLIMNVHGGPEAHERNGWLTAYSKPGQVAAGQGYAVFLPNYRGSTAYGVAFSKAHQNDYAGKEFNDIVDAKRYFVAKGIADPDRVGITGGSYGGYASAWGATALSAEYAASVMFVGISDQISKFGTTDIPIEMYNVHSRKWPWDDWQGMLEVSPIYHVDKAATPILIMHGAADPRVAPSQSYELYRNIKIRTDTPVRLVLYPGEGHGNRKAAARYEYNLRMMEWFDTYLKTGNRKAKMPGPRPQLAAGTKGANAQTDKTD